MKEESGFLCGEQTDTSRPRSTDVVNAAWKPDVVHASKAGTECHRTLMSGMCGRGRDAPYLRCLCFSVRHFKTVSLPSDSVLEPIGRRGK